MNNHFNSFQFAALLSSLGPLHLMLADALSPHGSNATLASVGTLSEGFERFVTSPLYLVGYVRWDARSDRVPPLQTIIFSSFTGRTKVCRPTARKLVFGIPKSCLRTRRFRLKADQRSSTPRAEIADDLFRALERAPHPEARRMPCRAS